MKKLAIVAAAAAALTSAHAAPFNGFSLGGNIGAAFTKYKMPAFSDYAAVVNGTSSNLKAVLDAQLAGGGITQSEYDAYVNVAPTGSISKTNFVADISAGYTKTFSSNVYAGAQIGFGYEKLTGFSGKAGNAYNVSFAPRLGYKFNETTGAYVKVALGKQFFSGEVKDFVKSSFFITPALGFEKAFGNVSMFGEFGYKIQKVQFKDIDLSTYTKTAGDRLIGQKVKKNAFVVTVGAAYNF